MASVEDIRIAVGWRDHHKRKKLQRRLGPGGVLALMDLWLWCGVNRPTGDLGGMTDEDVEIAALWDGEPGAFVRELVSLSLVERDDSGELALHDWADHQRWAASAAARSVAARKAADEKWGRSAVQQGAAPPPAKRHERLAAARAKGTHSEEEWQALLAFCGSKCLRCGGAPAVKDHIEPIYRGGSDSIENLQPLCVGCNSRKGPERSDLRPARWRECLPQPAKTPAGSSENACETPAGGPVDASSVSVSVPVSVSVSVPVTVTAGRRADGLTAKDLLDAWNSPPPGVRWPPASHNAEAFRVLAEELAPAFGAWSSGNADTFCLSAISAFVAVRELWVDRGGAPALSPKAMASEKWLPRVLEAMAGRLSQQGPGRDFAQPSGGAVAKVGNYGGIPEGEM